MSKSKFNASAPDTRSSMQQTNLGHSSNHLGSSTQGADHGCSDGRANQMTTESTAVHRMRNHESRPGASCSTAKQSASSSPSRSSLLWDLQHGSAVQALRDGRLTASVLARSPRSAELQSSMAPSVATAGCVVAGGPCGSANCIKPATVNDAHAKASVEAVHGTGREDDSTVLPPHKRHFSADSAGVPASMCASCHDVQSEPNQQCSGSARNFVSQQAMHAQSSSQSYHTCISSFAESDAHSLLASRSTSNARPEASLDHHLRASSACEQAGPFDALLVHSRSDSAGRTCGVHAAMPLSYEGQFAMHCQGVHRCQAD